ncbi:acyltransferase family protein [Polynucleobacter necessarius]|uniref:acyltransferase family protein n=1 Tax=Polynucleobacter necessarius TaxID=576610 RepID=UPI0018D55892|nr:acyltransferase family protein [Polynucleobacter necessarius]
MKLAIWFGLISFPLYLWHWPLLSFARIFEGEVPSTTIRATAVALAIILAWATYKFIESPFRKGYKFSRPTRLLIFCMACIALAAIVIYIKNGAPSRPFQSKYVKYAGSIRTPEKQQECSDINHAYEIQGKWFCHLGRTDKPIQYFVYGDSHAAMLIPAFENFAEENNVGMLLTSTSGCPPLLGIQSMRGRPSIDRYNCKKLNERVFSYVKSNKIPNVILAARWTYYLGGISRPNEFNFIALDESKEPSKGYSRHSFKVALEKTISEYQKIGVNLIFF